MGTADTYKCINDLLVNLFKDILYLEESAVSTDKFADLSMNDWHVIEAIGTEAPKSMSSIARELSVTVGSLTTAMNRLYKKGYVDRAREESDRRVVNISLTQKGRDAYTHHAKFHEEMIDAIIRDQSPEELEVLVKSLTRLTKFFRGYDKHRTDGESGTERSEEA